jgi:isocitrate lyase
VIEHQRSFVKIEYTLAELDTKRLWDLLHTRPFVPALGAFTGNQAIRMVKGGLEAVYQSGREAAAAANLAAICQPDRPP